MQKIRIEIRAMDVRMTACTVASRLKAQATVGDVCSGRIDVAREAKKTFFATDQKKFVDAPVRGVAYDAALNLDSRMFEDEGAPLFDMALHARFPTRLPQHGTVAGAVCIVAIRAFHRAFRNRVMRWKGKLTDYVPMTLSAQVWLILLQQAAVQPPVLVADVRYGENNSLRALQRSTIGIARRFYQMSRVTSIAADTVAGMCRTTKFAMVMAAAVTGEAAAPVLFGISFEREISLLSSMVAASSPCAACSASA